MAFRTHTKSINPDWRKYKLQSFSYKNTHTLCRLSSNQKKFLWILIHNAKILTKTRVLSALCKISWADFPIAPININIPITVNAFIVTFKNLIVTALKKYSFDLLKNPTSGYQHIASEFPGTMRFNANVDSKFKS